MSKIKRKARTKLIKKVDMLKPVDILSFGSEDDPCFGKHFKPSTPECSRCGDSELCAMKMAQLAHIKREEIESKQAFKDMEEKSIPDANRKELRKAIKARIKELIKMAGKTGVKEDTIVNDVFTMYSKDGFTKKKIKKILEPIKEYTYITTKNDKLTWNK